MFSCESEIFNVSSYAVHNRLMLICDTSGKLYLNNEVIGHDVDSRGYTLIDNRFIVWTEYRRSALASFNSDFNTRIFDLTLRQTKDFLPKVLIHSYSMGSVLAAVDKVMTPDGGFSANYDVYSFPQMDKIKSLGEMRFGRYLRVGEAFIFHHGNEIHFFDLEANTMTRKILVGRIQSFLIVANDVLWFEHELTPHHRVVRGIDIRTGNFLDDFIDLKLPTRPMLKVVGNDAIFITNMPAAHQDSVFIELDLNTRKKVRSGTIQSLNTNNPHLALFGCTIENDKIYFNARVNNSLGGEAVGVLDYQSLDLLWWEKKSEDHAFFAAGQSPKVSGERFYILDTKDVLYTYKKSYNPLR